MDTSEQQGIDGFNLHSRIAANELMRRRLMGENIRLLSMMKDKELYKAVLGDDKAEWVAYLGQVETFYSRNTVYNLMRVYDKFVIDLGYDFETISDIPLSRLTALLVVINNENMTDLLDKARVLTSRDFNDEIREIKGLPVSTDCKHDYKQLEVCKHCGEKHELKHNEIAK